MADKRDQVTPAAVPQPAPSSGGRSKKREYRRPSLVAYGEVKQLTRSASGTVGDGLGMSMRPSDPALKECIWRIGDHPAGFGLYLFNYKPEFRDAHGYGRQFGVMADEVERVLPDAVRRTVDGYRLVDYARLGIVRTRC